MPKYHPEYDEASNYIEAAKNQTDPETKVLLEKAAATIAYLQKYRQGTQALLVKMNNTIVDAEDDLCNEDLDEFFPDINYAIETGDDVNNKFSIPYESWKHLSSEKYITKQENVISEQGIKKEKSIVETACLKEVKNLTWEDPIRTFSLNGEELPAPRTTGGGFCLESEPWPFVWDTRKDKNMVKNAIIKLLSGVPIEMNGPRCDLSQPWKDWPSEE